MDITGSDVRSSLRCEKQTCCGITFHRACESRQPSISQLSCAAPVMVRAGSSWRGPPECLVDAYTWSERY
jgi:hypothetical protein